METGRGGAGGEGIPGRGNREPGQVTSQCELEEESLEEPEWGMGHLNGLGAELMGQRGKWGRGGVGVGVRETWAPQTSSSPLDGMWSQTDWLRLGPSRLKISPSRPWGKGGRVGRALQGV